LYILNKQEEAMLKIIIKNTRVDYFRKNKHIFKELNIENEILYSNDNMEEDLENKLDNKVKADRFGDIC